MKRLTAGECAVAADPANIEYARRFANTVARKYPSIAQDIESAALMGLVTAAAMFEPERGVAFVTIAHVKIRWAIYDCVRTELRRGLTGGKRIAAELGSRFGPEADTVAADQLPVGWEAESEDEVRAVCLKFPDHRARTALECFLLDCSGGNYTIAGHRIGVSQSRVTGIIGQALKDAFPGHEITRFPRPVHPRKRYGDPEKERQRSRERWMKEKNSRTTVTGK